MLKVEEANKRRGGKMDAFRRGGIGESDKGTTNGLEKCGVNCG